MPSVAVTIRVFRPGASFTGTLTGTSLPGAPGSSCRAISAPLSVTPIRSGPVPPVTLPVSVIRSAATRPWSFGSASVTASGAAAGRSRATAWNARPLRSLPSARTSCWMAGAYQNASSSRRDWGEAARKRGSSTCTMRKALKVPAGTRTSW